MASEFKLGIGYYAKIMIFIRCVAIKIADLIKFWI